MVADIDAEYPPSKVNEESGDSLELRQLKMKDLIKSTAWYKSKVGLLDSENRAT
jgi:hypothetical protein